MSDFVQCGYCEKAATPGLLDEDEEPICRRCAETPGPTGQCLFPRRNGVDPLSLKREDILAALHRRNWHLMMTCRDLKTTYQSLLKWVNKHLPDEFKRAKEAGLIQCGGRRPPPADGYGMYPETRDRQRIIDLVRRAGGNFTLAAQCVGPHCKGWTIAKALKKLAPEVYEEIVKQQQKRRAA